MSDVLEFSTMLGGSSISKTQRVKINKYYINLGRHANLFDYKTIPNLVSGELVNVFCGLEFAAKPIFEDCRGKGVNLLGYDYKITFNKHMDDYHLKDAKDANNIKYYVYLCHMSFGAAKWIIPSEVKPIGFSNAFNYRVNGKPLLINNKNILTTK